MAIDYAQRLQNLISRRTDNEAINESTFANSALARQIPANLRYLADSMRPIDQAYNVKTKQAAQLVRHHLESAMQFHLRRTYRTQGSVETKTNIKIHSDYDLLLIIEGYRFVEIHDPTSTYTATVPDDDIALLRKEATRVLKQIYDEVDETGPKSISILNKHLNRKVDVVFCFWYDSQTFITTKREFHRGVHLYDFPQRRKVPADYPFATIENVNSKGDLTNDASRKGIRFLKTIRADKEDEIKILKGFHLMSLVHDIENHQLSGAPGNEIQIASKISEKLGRLIGSPSERKSLRSPNKMETPLADDNTLPELKLLKNEVDTIIEDTVQEIRRGLSTQSSFANYAARN